MKTIELSLSQKSIEDAIAELELMKTRVATLSRSILNSLLEIGIVVGRESGGDYADYISFSAYVEKDDVGHIGMLVARDRQKIKREWWYRGQKVSVDISPLLMAEFGSGWLSIVSKEWESLAGEVGQGTFPEQKHAFDPDGWHWTDTQGGYHKSRGEAPSFPVYRAWMAMKQAIDETARKEMAFFFS